MVQFHYLLRFSLLCSFLLLAFSSFASACYLVGDEMNPGLSNYCAGACPGEFVCSASYNRQGYVYVCDCVCPDSARISCNERMASGEFVFFSSELCECVQIENLSCSGSFFSGYGWGIKQYYFGRDFSQICYDDCPEKSVCDPKTCECTPAKYCSEYNANFSSSSWVCIDNCGDYPHLSNTYCDTETCSCVLSCAGGPYSSEQDAYCKDDCKEKKGDSWTCDASCSCKCVESALIEKCTSEGKIPDLTTCDCLCDARQKQDCSPPRIWDETKCSCECDASEWDACLFRGDRWDEESCTCIPASPSTVSCSLPSGGLGDTKSLIPQTNTSSDFDPSLQICITTTCPEPDRYVCNARTCTCECDYSALYVLCAQNPPRLYANPDSCSCECPQFSCPPPGQPGRILKDFSTCTCQCSPLERSRCMKKSAQDPSWMWDEESCLCQKSNSTRLCSLGPFNNLIAPPPAEDESYCLGVPIFEFFGIRLGGVFLNTCGSESECRSSDGKCVSKLANNLQSQGFACADDCPPNMQCVLSGNDCFCRESEKEPIVCSSNRGISDPSMQQCISDACTDHCSTCDIPTCTCPEVVRTCPPEQVWDEETCTCKPKEKEPDYYSTCAKKSSLNPADFCKDDCPENYQCIRSGGSCSCIKVEKPVYYTCAKKSSSNSADFCRDDCADQYGKDFTCEVSGTSCYCKKQQSQKEQVFCSDSPSEFNPQTQLCMDNCPACSQCFATSCTCSEVNTACPTGQVWDWSTCSCIDDISPPATCSWIAGGSTSGGSNSCTGSCPSPMVCPNDARTEEVCRCTLPKPKISASPNPANVGEKIQILVSCSPCGDAPIIVSVETSKVDLSPIGGQTTATFKSPGTRMITACQSGSCSSISISAR